jgi:hypothetical protein
MIYIVTAHGSNSFVSKLISYFSKRSEQWSDKLQNELQSISDEFPYVPAPSHAFAMIGEDDFIESDWGENAIPLIPFWRKNAGVRRITKTDLENRRSFHIIWKIQSTPKQSAEFREKLVDMASYRIEYDFIGLLGASYMTYRKGHYSNLDNRKKFFCSELIAYALESVGIKKKHPILRDNDITPALLPTEYNAKPFIIF